tara:strand:+ start:295 stop:1113 length:819 start_codon:yes stop_codon:yes gene_type:complete
MSKKSTTEEEEEIKEEDVQAFVVSLHKQVGFLNDLLLLPMFASILIESQESSLMNTIVKDSELLFCGLFLLEWILGLIASPSKKSYATSPLKILDLISTIPLGSFYQGLRIFRLFRVIKLFRVVLRSRKYQGPGADLFRLVAIVGSTTFAGAYTMYIVEGSKNEQFSSISETLWWSLVTISTVGYGDKYPITPEGRLVAVVLILIGVGVCGYIAGFMANLMNVDDDTDKGRLERVESKLDILAEHLKIENWPQPDTKDNSKEQESSEENQNA